MGIASAEYVSSVSRTTESVVATNISTPQRLCKGDAKRVSLIFSNQGGGGAFLSTQSNIASSQGVQLGASAVPLMINIRDHGGLVNLEWWVAPGIATSIRVIETSIWEKEQEEESGK